MADTTSSCKCCDVWSYAQGQAGPSKANHQKWLNAGTAIPEMDDRQAESPPPYLNWDAMSPSLDSTSYGVYGIAAGSGYIIGCGAAPTNGFVFKRGEFGDLIWQVDDTSDAPWNGDCVMDNSGNIYVSSFFTNTVAKYNNDGTRLWTDGTKGARDLYHDGTSLYGVIGRDVWKRNSDGTLQWSTQLPGTSGGPSGVTSDGSSVYCCQAYTFFSNHQVWWRKLDSDGTLQSSTFVCGGAVNAYQVTNMADHASGMVFGVRGQDGTNSGVYCYDTDGTQVYEHLFLHSGVGSIAHGTDTYYIYNGGNGRTDECLRLDSDGSAIWDVVLFSGANADRYCVECASDSNVFYTGGAGIPY